MPFIEYGRRSDNNRARLRGTFNTFANIPLQVTLSREERKFNNAKFEWILCNRLRVQQPTAKDMTIQKCKCGINIEDGRHFRKCPRFQGTPRTNADRPADAYIKTWPIVPYLWVLVARCCRDYMRVHSEWCLRAAWNEERCAQCQYAWR